MAAIYDYKYDKFNTETLQDIHRNIFGQIFDWAGEFRSIQMVKYEDVLGEDNETDTLSGTKADKYAAIGEYKVKDYKERPHEYTE